MSHVTKCDQCNETESKAPAWVVVKERFGNWDFCGWDCLAAFASAASSRWPDVKPRP